MVMAHFGLKYYAQMRSRYKGVFRRVEIAEREYSGASEEMELSGNTPLQITWESRGDEFFVPVKASEVTITIMCHENFHYLGLFTSDPRKFRVSIYRTSSIGEGLWWPTFIPRTSPLRLTKCPSRRWTALSCFPTSRSSIPTIPRCPASKVSGASCHPA